MNVVAMEETIYELTQASFGPAECSPQCRSALGSNGVKLSEDGSVTIFAYGTSDLMLVCGS